MVVPIAAQLSASALSLAYIPGIYPGLQTGLPAPPHPAQGPLEFSRTVLLSASLLHDHCDLSLFCACLLSVCLPTRLYVSQGQGPGLLRPVLESEPIMGKARSGYRVVFMEHVSG